MAHRLTKLRTLIIGIVAALPIAGTQTQAQPSFTTLSDGVLRACLYTAGSPVSSLENGIWSGWDVDFLTGFAEAHGLRLEPVAIEVFAGLWERPGNGECDLTSGVTYIDQRVAATPDAAWSDAYFRAKRSVIVREDARDELTSVDDLAGRTILVWPRSPGEIDVTRRIEAGGVADVTIEPPGNAITALMKVRDGEAFAFEGDLTFQRNLVPASRRPGSGRSCRRTARRRTKPTPTSRARPIPA